MRAQKLPCIGLAPPQRVESFWTRDQTCVPCTGRLILIHCTTREVPQFISYLNLLSLTTEEGFPRPPDTELECRSWGQLWAREPGLAAWEGAEGSQVSPPCLHQVGLTLTVLRMMTTGYCFVEDERGSAEEAWLRGGQKGTQALGGWSTAGPGCPAGSGRASRAGQGRGWSLGGALSRRDRISTSGRGMAVGGASSTPCVGGLTIWHETYIIWILSLQLWCFLGASLRLQFCLK